jgi:hypothetical protein
MIKTKRQRQLESLERKICRVSSNLQWRDTEDDVEITSCQYFIVREGHNVVLPKAPKDNQILYFAPSNGDWQTLNGTFEVDPPTQIVNASESLDADSQVLGLLYNEETDTWVFIEAGQFSYINVVGGGGGAVDSVNGETGVVTLDTGDIPEGSNLYFTDLRVASSPSVSANTAKRSYPLADENKLSGIESNATADQTGAEIVSAIDIELGGSGWQSGGGATNHSALTLDDGTNPHGTTASDVGLGNVDNTSDLAKPISVATQTALDEKVDNSQVLTNVPAGAIFTDTQRTNEEIEDVVGAQFNHANHTNITATYDDVSGEVRLTGSVGGQVDSVIGGTGITVDATDPANPIVSRNALTKADIVDFSDGDYATAAQGTLADSAIQSGDIDTLTKLNAVVSDATLIDTSDPRLSDDRNPTAHTHTAAEITDFDTEVGNNVDVSANTAHRGLTNNPHSVTAVQVGLGNVDNTSDANKPVSAAQQSALDGKADSVHTHTKSDITDFNDGDYATAAQGATADSAIQPGDIDTLAELNGIITDATLIDTSDPRLSDARTPTAHTHTASEITDFDAEVVNNAAVTNNTAKRSYPIGDETKLSGIESGATANSTDAALRDRSTHTGTQPASTITGLSAVATSGNYSDLSGTPDLSAFDNIFEAPTLAGFPGTGSSDVFYLDQNSGILYRWTGSAYSEISAQLALGETSSTAYRGDRGKTAYDHSQLNTGNPHNVTASDVGLGNVDNTSDVDKPVSTATQTALDGKANSSHTHTLTDITDAGTSAGLDVAATGDAAVGEVVKGDDSRLTDARVPLAHTHVKADITDFNDADYATAAQGVLADSAIQEGDIDTLAELNAIITDATLVDTNDPRLSDDRNPNPHTHTASEVTDFDVEVSNNVDVSANTIHKSLINNPHSVTASQVGLGNVDNTSDVDKPVSTAQQAALDGKANNSHTHTLSQITDSGTSASLNVAAIGDAAVGEVVKGDDTRLTDSRTPLAHTHTASEITDFDTEVANNTDVSTNTTHRGLTNNPHSVTAAQVGLGAVPNIDATDRANHTGTQTASTISDFDTEVSNNTTVQSAFTTANNNVTTINNLSSDDIGNDSGVFAPTVTGALDSLSSAIGSTVSADGSVTTHNDVTDAGSGQIITGVERTKLDGIEAGAEVNVNADWNAVGGDAEILNKPNIPDSSDDISNDSSVVGGTVTNAIDNLNSGKLESVAGGTDISIDATDPLNPIINFTGASGGASDTIDVTQTGHGFSAGDVLKFVDNVTPYQLAQADSPVNAEVIGIVSSVTDVNNFVLQIGGVVEGGAVPSGTQGDVVFLSPTVAGGTTTTRPSIVGQIAKPIGILIDSGTKMRWVDFVGVEIAGAGSGGGLVSGDIDTLAKLNGLVTDATLIDTNDVRLSDARTPTAHTHTKSDITDFSDGDYATAAQGSTADSALQPGDIDTLAELNGVLTDATLIDTTDPRLSDARTPISHTHTGSEITDFPKDKSIYIENPLEIDNITLWRTNTAITITGVHGVVRGSSPSALFAIKYSTDRSVTGTDLDSTGFTITSSTTGNSFSSFTSPNIPAGSWIWLEGDTYSGTINDLSITINYTE